MAEAGAAAPGLTGRTVWARNLALPVRDFLSTEVGSSFFLLGATVAALLWANVDWSSYQSLWATELSIRVGSHGISQDLHGWVNNGLMTFFFLVIGLEARREFDVGDLRERRRAMLPLLAGLGGLAVPVLVYLAFNLGGSGASGWGAAMSTDTAFALGVLAVVGRSCPDRLRVFMLTVVVVDDLVALVVIGAAYSHDVVYGYLAVAAVLLVVVLVLRSLEFRSGPLFAAIGAAMWLTVYESGVEPVITGLAMGLLTYAYPATRLDLERATKLFRSFREQPTPELARTAQRSLVLSVSPNERLQNLWHPWTSYVIVPLFALANAGIPISRTLLRHSFASSVTLGILVGYVVGKPVGIAGATWILSRLRPGLRLPVGWAPLVGGGVVAGIGFTVSLLIASLAFHGEQLQEAKVGVLTAALAASLLGWLAFRVVALLPARYRTATSERLVDLAVPVDRERDHVRGSDEAPVTLVEYGDYECPFCGRAEPVVREIVDEFGDDLRYVFRAAAARRRAPARPAGGRGGGGGGGAGQVLGDARPAVPAPGRAEADGSRRVRRAARPRRRPVHRRAAPAGLRLARGRGHRHRRPERRHRHADVLRQRAPPPGRLRPRHALGRGQGRPAACASLAPESPAPSAP